MALLDMDSFDYYQTTELAEVYDNVDPGNGVTLIPANQIEIGTGRCGTNCLAIESFPGNTGVVRGINTTATTVVWGCGINPTSVGGYDLPVLTLLSAGIPTHRLMLNIDGSLTGYFNPDSAFPSVSFTSMGGLIGFDVYNYLEFYVFMSPTPGDPGTGVGVVKIAVNGVLKQTLTGLQTCWSIDNPVPTAFRMGGSQFRSFIRFDDMYFLDNLGPAPWNNMLGDRHVQRLRPVGAGGVTQFSLTGAATNWQAQDKGDTPDTSSYVSASTVGFTDAYQYEDLANVPGTVISGVKISSQAQKDAAGTRTIEFLKRNAAVDYPTGEQLGLTVLSWDYEKSILMNDPQTGAQWSGISSINGSSGNQFGIKVSS